MDGEKKEIRYPFTKAIRNRKKRFECVYAGPVMKPGPMEGVYAGPAADPPMAPVYAGPAPERDGAEFEDVYAGPEFFERGAQDDIAEPVPVEESEASENRFMLVYAGPAWFAKMAQNEKPVPVCERCGARVPENAKFCPDCGTPLVKKV